MEEKFDIYFLSVRSDAEEGRKLAESIRTYQLPKNTILPDPALSHTHIRVDCENEPFSGRIREQLLNSRYLVLICSPETKNDPVILEKLEAFRTMHGSEEIVLCIAQGEPMDSFPESFIEKKTVRKTLPDLSVVERIETIEPVAADLRGDTKQRRRELLRYETVRITASVLGLHPDDLEQRHRSRRRREIMMMLIMAGIICSAAAAIFLRLGLIAREEGRVADEQTRLSLAIVQRTIQELPASFEGEEEAQIYIGEAIDHARTALRDLDLDHILEETEKGGGE
ncbi:MAG: hypothetical protein J6P48_02995 [Oscillospiraceae bacterium]|nr:hypothetical protein [Oscillospiraceae bacterium]